MCDILADPIGCFTEDAVDVAEAAVVGGAKAMIEELLVMATEWVTSMLAINATWWVHLPTPDLSTCGILHSREGGRTLSPSCGDTSGAIESLQNHTAWIAAIVAVFALIAAGTRMAATRDGGEAGNLLRGLLTFVAATTGGIAITQLLIRASDAYAHWIITAAADDLAQSITESFYLEQEAMMLAMLILACLGGLIGWLQFGMMIARLAGLILFSGLLPVAAAAAMTRGGQAMLTKYLGWLFAFILYKPAAATIYATVFWMLDNSTFGSGIYGTFLEALVILMMMVLAIFALPALMRLITPAVAALAAAGSGAGGFAAVAASGTAVATGAAELRSRHKASSETTQTGQSGPPPSGAPTTGATPPKPPTPPGGASTAGKGAAAVGGAKVAGALAAGAATAGVATAAMVAIEGAKKVHEGIQKAGDTAAGDGPTGADGGGK